MRVFADQCVWQCTVDFLRDEGHEVRTALEAGLCETEDELLLEHAVSQGCVLLTRDMGFSNTLIYPPASHLGLIVLKIKPETAEAVHAVLRVALSRFTQESIQRVLIIVDHNKYRIRR